MSTIPFITQRPILRPDYATAETFDAWIQINGELVDNYWRQLEGDGDAAEFMEFARTQYDVSNPEVADCDVCQYRPGTHTVRAAGVETWVCDKCTECQYSTANAWQDRDADEAGQPAYGEL